MSLLKFFCFLICVVAVCSKPQIQTRVIGGSDVANINTYPYVVSLRQKLMFPLILGPLLTYSDPKPHFCTGSIIASNWILTANHCLCISFVYSTLNSIVNGLPLDLEFAKSTVCHLQTPGAFVVQANTLNLNTVDSTNEYAVAKSIPHPDFNSKTIENDIGLVQLERSITNAVSITIAIQLPADNIAAILLGWGLTDGESSTLPNTLQEGEVNIVPLNDCQTAMANTGGSVTAGNVCAFGGGNIGACNGDSGGPLVVNINGSPNTVGVTSWGRKGCDTASPTVFASVFHFSAYIKETTGIN